MRPSTIFYQFLSGRKNDQYKQKADEAACDKTLCIYEVSGNGATTGNGQTVLSADNAIGILAPTAAHADPRGRDQSESGLYERNSVPYGRKPPSLAQAMRGDAGQR